MPQATSAQPRTIDDAARHVRECVKRADAYGGKGVWITRCTPAQIDAQLARLAALVTTDQTLPLLGMTFAVKDNIDVAGLPTTAACPAFAYAPRASATVVRRLTDAGAIVLGKTNLDQFATGLNGTRSPYGACENFYDRAYISGGSSSGSAVAVAAGIVDFSLGTDTAGSGRVPASFNNLVGYKPSKGLVSTTGVVPACRSLDCVSVFAQTLETTRRVATVAGGFDEHDAFSRDFSQLPPYKPDSLRVGVPERSQLQFFGDAEAEANYHAAVERVGASGATIKTIDYSPFNLTAELLYQGPWVAERLAAVDSFARDHAADMLDVIRTIILGGSKFSAVDTFKATYRLAELRRLADMQWRDMDLLLLPTTGTIYTIARMLADPIRLNTDLGYYTNFVNLLDLSALAVPNGFRADGLPAGVTFMAPANGDAFLFTAAEQLGFTGDSR